MSLEDFSTNCEFETSTLYVNRTAAFIALKYGLLSDFSQKHVFIKSATISGHNFGSGRRTPKEMIYQVIEIKS